MPNINHITHIQALRTLAKRKVPRAIFDYADRGSYDEVTLNRNTRDLKNISLRQRVLIDVKDRALQTSILGKRWSLPVAIAPTGLAGIMHANGEILAAQAAEVANIPFSLSTMSICSLEQVKANTTRPFWFQLYVMKDRDFVADLIKRAKKANCSALILTCDLQVQGQRHSDIKNGLTVPPKVTLKNMLNLITKPGWCFNMSASKSRCFGNLVNYMNSDNISTLSKWIASQFDDSLNWQDVDWVKKLWGGRLIIKGILDVEDAKLAVQAGADAIIVSNHGGRQLDGAKSAISQLPKIVAAVGHDIEILFDSGILSGQDVLKAVALGAGGTFIGKAFLYGLGAGGKPGVLKAIDIIKNELNVSMALTGIKDIANANHANLITQ